MIKVQIFLSFLIVVHDDVSGFSDFAVFSPASCKSDSECPPGIRFYLLSVFLSVLSFIYRLTISSTLPSTSCLFICLYNYPFLMDNAELFIGLICCHEQAKFPDQLSSSHQMSFFIHWVFH